MFAYVYHSKVVFNYYTIYVLQQHTILVKLWLTTHIKKKQDHHHQPNHWGMTKAVTQPNANHAKTSHELCANHVASFE